MRKIFLSLSIITIPLFSFGWNASGHMTSGAIAYYYLKENNPIVLQKVLTVLKHHPWYATRWNDSIVAYQFTNEDKDIAIFMFASTFADDGRKLPEYGGSTRAKWHYVDYPYTPFPEQVTYAVQPKSPNAEIRINELLSSLKGSKNTEETAIDLCWLFHLIQDIHQPLHTVSMYDSDRPNGDRGGNDVFVLKSKESDTIKLHYFWDAVLQTKVQLIPEASKSLMEKRKYKLSKLKEIEKTVKIEDWIRKESYYLAVDEVYNYGKINGTELAPTLLSNSYKKQALKIGEKRIVVSGIRLAETLIEIYQ